jgi:hypothetical protein
MKRRSCDTAVLADDNRARVTRIDFTLGPGRGRPLAGHQRPDPANDEPVILNLRQA